MPEPPNSGSGRSSRLVAGNGLQSLVVKNHKGRATLFIGKLRAELPEPFEELRVRR